MNNRLFRSIYKKMVRKEKITNHNTPVVNKSELLKLLMMVDRKLKAGIINQIRVTLNSFYLSQLAEIDDR